MSHHNTTGFSTSGWEQQLQAAERQYSDFFPDLDLPPDPQDKGQSQPPTQEDTSTLFSQYAYMTALTGLGVSSISSSDLATSGLNSLDDSRRYSHASIGQMELLDELDTVLQGLVTKTCR